MSDIYQRLQSRYQPATYNSDLTDWAEKEVTEIRMLDLFEDQIFVETPGEKEIFWRCDDRDPTLNTIYENGIMYPIQRTGVTWRVGGDYDDLNGHTAVCLSRTIEGACFFPCMPQNNTTTYLYAIRLSGKYFDSEKMQKTAHRSLNPNDLKVRNTYYPYDPTENEVHGWISPRWLYGEVVVPRLLKTDIVGCWKLQRDFLVRKAPNSNDSHNSKPGVVVTQIDRVPGFSPPQGLQGQRELQSAAQRASKKVHDWQIELQQMCRNHEYYSYGGVVKHEGDVFPATTAEADIQFYGVRLIEGQYKNGDEVVGGKLSLVTRSPWADSFEYKK